MLIQIEKDGKSVIKQMKGKGDVFNITLPRSLCGSYTYYTRVSLEGVKNSTSALLGFRGYCPQKITKSEWRKSPKGANIANGTPIKYGDTIYLYLETEGLNGEKLTVEVYNSVTLLSDTLIRKIVLVEVEDGRVALKIPNTTLWMGAVSNIQEVEEFYVKIKNAKGQYILNSKQEEDHAEYLKIKKEVSSTNIEKPSNTTVLKIGETTVKLNRHEPCKFEEISITETETKDGKATNSTVKVFDNGKGLKSAKGTTEKVTTSIYFKFDVDVVDEKSKQALQNVLNFLLEHPHSGIRLEGYACVIGKQNYNNGLSQRRSDAVKKFFLDGGLKADRILSLGKGEVNATDDKQGRDNIKYKDEKEYINNRRVDVSFVFEGHNAQTIVYETIAPSSDKNILLEVKGFETKSCFKTKDKHTKKIKVTSPAYPAAKVQNGDKMQIPVRSTLEAWDPAPIHYFWPKYNILILAESANPYNIYVHSCRYFSNEKDSVILIKVFPDIKWELAFEIKIDIKHYSHTNMPSEMRIFERHQELATKNGYKRYLLNKDKEIPITIGFGLSAEWNEEKRKVNVSKEWEKKIEAFAKYFAKTVELVQDGINVCRGLAKSTSIPVSFGVEYPKIEATFEWKLKRAKKSLTELAVGGTVNFGAKPLIGANVTIDLIAAAVSIASYSTTGSPAIARIVEKVRATEKKVGTEITAEAKFYGNLEVLFKDMKFNTIDGWEGSSYLLIGGKMGMRLMIEGKIGNSPWYKKKKPKIEFSAIARATGDAYFGGTLKIDYDENKKSMYIQPSVKFSGLEVVLEAEVTVGWFKESGKLKYEEVVPSKEIEFEKKYISSAKENKTGGGGF